MYKDRDPPNLTLVVYYVILTYSASIQEFMMQEIQQKTEKSCF